MFLIQIQGAHMGKTTQTTTEEMAVYELMSPSQFENNVGKSSFEVPEKTKEAVQKKLSTLYETYTSPNSTLSQDELEFLRFSLLVDIYDLTYSSGFEPLEELASQSENFIRHFRQIPADTNLSDEISEWKKETTYKANIVTKLPEQTGRAQHLKDLVSLETLLSEEHKDDMRAQNKKARELAARLYSSRTVLDSEVPNLLELDKKAFYRRTVLHKDFLDTFKKGTFGVANRETQKSLQDQGFHVCDSKERSGYRVYVDVQQKRFLKEQIVGEGDDIQLTFVEATTNNKKAFVEKPSMDEDDLFTDTAMFIIDNNGRMFLFSVDDHEAGLSHASFMACDSVLFAGRASLKNGVFELHSSSHEYNTNQRMSKVTVHHLSTLAPLLKENDIVLSAPVLKTDHARIVVEKPAIKTEEKLTESKQIELARALPLNIPSFLAANGKAPSEGVQNLYSIHEGHYWQFRPEEIFPSGATLPNEFISLSNEERLAIFAQNKATKDYIAKRFDLPTAHAIWQVTTEDFEMLMQELTNKSPSAELVGDDNNPITLPKDGITEVQEQSLGNYYYLRQTATKVFKELDTKAKEDILKQFSLNDPEGIWLLNEEDFQTLTDTLQENFNANVIRWLNSQYETIHKSLRPIVDPSRGIDVAWDLNFKRQLDSVIPSIIIPQIHQNMFKEKRKKGEVEKTAQEIQQAFEAKAKEKRISFENLNAIWSIGSEQELLHFLRRLLQTKSLLTEEEFKALKARANKEKKPQQGAKFDEFIAKPTLPEKPEIFSEDEFEAVKEAHALVMTRVEALTEYYYARRDFSDNPFKGISDILSGEFYCKPKPHPWQAHRALIYFLLILTIILLAALIVSFILFAPQALALTPSMAGFAFKVVMGYVLATLGGGALGFGAAFGLDKFFTPKPFEASEEQHEYWQFYQLPEDEITKGANVGGIIPDEELFVSGSEIR